MDETGPNEVTLGDVLRLAVPLSTAVMTGAGQKRRVVNWVALLVSWSDLAVQAAAGDLVILPPSLHDQLTAYDLAEGLSTLAALPATAVIVFRDLPERATAVADDLDLPILAAPTDAAVRDIHRNIAALLLDRQAQTVERGMQLYRQLSEMSREGQGLEAMTDVMARLTGKLVVVQDKRLDVQAIGRPTGDKSDLEALVEALRRRDNLPPTLRNRKAAARARQSHWQQLLPVDDMARLVSPIVVGDRARGYLSVVGPPDALDMLDSLTAEHGAAACALEMAKAKAVSEAKKALRGDFLEGLLAGQLPQKEIDRLASRLDHDTELPHIIMVLAWDSEAKEIPSLRRLETVVNWLLSTSNRPALADIYADDHVCVFQALRERGDVDTAQELLNRLHDHLEAEYPEARLIGGLAGPALALLDWPRFHQQALQAMQLGRRLGLRQVVEYGSLGIYQLLTELDGITAVEAFCQEMIGPLARYDAGHNSTLVRTLDAYFKHHSNVSQTAESLFIHRNTLLYRLDRIQELTGKDLNQSDTRLAFHLALKLWQLRPNVNASDLQSQ